MDGTAQQTHECVTCRCAIRSVMFAVRIILTSGYTNPKPNCCISLFIYLFLKGTKVCVYTSTKRHVVKELPCQTTGIQADLGRMSVYVKEQPSNNFFKVSWCFIWVFFNSFWADLVNYWGKVKKFPFSPKVASCLVRPDDMSAWFYQDKSKFTEQMCSVTWFIGTICQHPWTDALWDLINVH